MPRCENPYKPWELLLAAVAIGGGGGAAGMMIIDGVTTRRLIGLGIALALLFLASALAWWRRRRE